MLEMFKLKLQNCYGHMTIRYNHLNRSYSRNNANVISLYNMLVSFGTSTKIMYKIARQYVCRNVKEVELENKSLRGGFSQVTEN